MIMNLQLFALLFSLWSDSTRVTAFQSPSLYIPNVRNGVLRKDLTPLNAHNESGERRVFLESLFVGSSMSFVALSSPANALVKGNAPPPKKSATEEKKCTNVEACQEMAERLASQQDEEMRANMTPPKVASGGSRYRDIVDGPEDSAIAKNGDDISIRYKVLKLGKRSYDGLSGEATVVFSRGYFLEDDEEKGSQMKTFPFKLGDNSVISALNDGVPGMKVGSTRRIGILPQMGWEKVGQACDGGPGGNGSGGELKTDYVIVPTATMVATEACFDKTKLPFPSTYAEQRRMAQRFDQSLIIEVELLKIV